MTADTPYRIQRPIYDGGLVFEIEKEKFIEREYAFCSMTMVWIGIFLESLTNHIIAETVPYKLLAISLIENPRLIYEQLSLQRKQIKSELSKKLIVLFNNQIDDKCISLIEEITSNRNWIVHDKPLDYYSDENGYSFDYYSIKPISKKELSYDVLIPKLLEFEAVLKLIIDRFQDKITLDIERSQLSFEYLIGAVEAEQ